VLLFLAAVVSIVGIVDGVVALSLRRAPGSTLLGAIVAATAVTLLVISLGTLTKMIALRGGGAVVAQSVGAVPVDPSTSDPRLRRYANIVEEMSIASGVPAPRLFVLEQESGINAFAAGYSPADAAVTVTSGALDRLNRDELQGVIGHEFSHVLNGDMRLNVRLIGLLNGILLLGLVGLRFLQFGGGRSRDSNGANPVLFVAVAFLVLGFVGQFFAGLIKAAVSRQREWLADASAVQFTRQTTGLAGALKKIAGLPEGSQLRDTHSERQINHMLFGEGARGVSQLLATHPPLLDRIVALEPSFDVATVSQLQDRYAQEPPDGLAEDAARGLVGAGPVEQPVRREQSVRVEPGAIRDRVATMTPPDIAVGARIEAMIPRDLRAAASQQGTAVPLVLAMLLDRRPDVGAAQAQIIRARLGATTAEDAARFYPALNNLDPILRLPIASIAAPLLIARPPAERRALATALDELARADGEITVFEYSLTRLIGAYLVDAGDPVPRSRPGRTQVASVRDAALTLLAVLSAAGNSDEAAAARAFAAAAAHLLPGSTVPYVPPPEPLDLARALDAGWEPLNSLDPKNKAILVEAMVIAVADDGVLMAGEAELLRTTCAMLRCPLPPLLS
jgi:Zn-dependent protease with chaperone function